MAIRNSEQKGSKAMLHKILMQASVMGVMLCSVSACSTMSSLELPSSPDQPWTPEGDVWKSGALQTAPVKEDKLASVEAAGQPANSARKASNSSQQFEGEAPASASTGAYTAHIARAPTGPVYSIPRVPDLPSIRGEAEYPKDRILDLPQLIDIAQRENPSTREAWNTAREAALSVGLTDALFLPVITANVVAGEQRLSVPVTLPANLGNVDINNKFRGVTPFVTLTWLLFDFGERNAIREGAEYAAVATNILFNATHQKVIRDVTDAYYRYNASRRNARLAQDSLVMHRHVVKAAEVRFAAGLATRVDIALAQQALAQGQLNVVTHEGFERTSYIALLDAMGVSPFAQLAIAEPELSQLPSAAAPLTQQRIEAVIKQRADIAAAYAAVKITEAGKKAADAAFYPKAYMAGGWAENRSHVEVGHLPNFGAHNAARGVLFGVTVPLYDGGLRSRQKDKAELAQEQAQLRLEHMQKTAVREIVVAEQVLKTALQSHDASQELVRTARVAHDALLASYRVGRVNTILLTESAIQVHKAQQAEAEAQYASVAAAVNLAFVMGTLVSAQSEWWPRSSAQDY